MSDLILPASCRQNAQMSKPIVFWHNIKRDHIMNAPGVDIKPPSGYVRVECRHAHEVEDWSSRLRAQEKRVHEMDDDDRYRYEDALRYDMILELKKNLEVSHDLRNRLFIKSAIEHFEAQRDKARPEHIVRETYQACESEEGVAS